MAATKVPHDIFNNPEAKASDFVNLNNKLIDDNILIRRQWEDDAKLVSLSYNGNKHPVLSYKRGDKTTTGAIRKEKDAESFVNLIKRQHRVITNYLNNNEPTFLITGFIQDTKNEDEVLTREFLNFVYEGQDPDIEAEDDMSFYDTTMDEVIWFGIMRGIAWTMVQYNE